MVLLEAPNAADSYFVPYYATLLDVNNTSDDPSDDRILSINMGREPVAKAIMRNPYGSPYGEPMWVPIYGLVKSGKDIVYRKLYKTEDFEFEGNVYTGIKPLYEVALEAGYNYGRMKFATYEEAVKAIDSMGLKEYDGSYTFYNMHLLKDVEIGNEKGDNKYATLPFPSKASNIDIAGNDYTITFTGNVTPRCNTSFYMVELIPVKMVKNEIVASKPDLSIGNNDVYWNGYIVDYADETNLGSFGKVTGGAKGMLRLDSYSYGGMTADSINGIGMLLIDDSFIDIQDNVTVKGMYINNGAILLGGTLTTDVIYQMYDSDLYILHNVDKPIVVNGVTESFEGTTLQDSVIVLDNYGGATSIPASVIVDTMTEDGSELSAGTKVVTGHYLNPDDWIFTDGSNAYSSYNIGNALYIGDRN